MENYIKTLLEQVRCKKAHSYIEEEIRGHIEEQIQTNISMGMTREEAIEEAVLDMGSPVEAGVALDQVHRPKNPWELRVLMGIIAVIGIVVHTAIGPEVYGSNRFAIHTLLGMLVMYLVYYMDYSFIARYAKLIAGSFLIAQFLAAATSFGLRVNGQIQFLAIGPLHFSVFAMMLLYVPVYGALLYEYYGTGYKGIVKAILWMIVPTYLAMITPSLSLAVIIFISMGIVFSIAVCKGWFKVSKKKVLGLFWGVTVTCPIIFLVTGIRLRVFANYQIARLYAFVTNSGDANYLTGRLRELLNESQFVGGNGMDIPANLPEYNTNFIFNYIVSTYGILAGVILCGILAFLVIKIFETSFSQKNQLGMIMGCGCGVVLMVNIALNILQNIGLMPITQSFLPFFSYGGSYIIVSYAMMGLILSIYRYKNIMPIRFKKERIRIRIEKEVM